MTDRASVSVLLIDEPARALPQLEHVLAQLGPALVRLSLSEALARGAEYGVALILLNASAPGSAFIDAIGQLRADAHLGKAPLLLLAPPGLDPGVADQAYAAGALDVLTQPLSVAALKSKAAFFITAFHTEAERQRSEEALRDTRERLDSTLSAAELATWSWDLQRDCLIADPLMARMFNIAPDAAECAPSAAYLDAVHPDDLANTRASIARAIDTGELYDVSYRVRGRDRQYRHVIARGHVSYLDDATPDRLRGVVMDVTRLRVAEDRLRASEERYRALFDSVDDGVCLIEVLFDAAGQPFDYRFLEINPAFAKHTGLVDAVGKTVLEMVPGHDAHWFRTYGRVAVSGEPVRFIDEAKALNRWYDTYATRVGGADSRIVAVLFTDISARVQAEAELQRLAADLSEADRRKSEFLATLAHELRNPLAPLRSGLQVLRLSGGDAATAARVHDVMERQLKHLVALVDDLLDVARITHGQVELKREMIDVAQVLAGAVETSMPLIDSEQHRLELDLAPEALTLFADPTRIRQVVSNLLNNAAKYTPRGGRITLSARREQDQLLLTIGDNGIGIESAALAKVFDMFTQVGRDKHRTRGGLGIGLSLVRSLVELHGGQVAAASAGPGLGSVFSVRLPLAPADSGAGAARDARRAPAQAGLRVLVVDDNADAAATLAELLGLIGHTAHVANDGQQALALAETVRPHVMFLDIGMPRMNGYDLARALRSDGRYADVLLAALTGWGGEEDRARTRAAGFDLHLTKPVDLDAVAELLGAHARRLGLA